LSTASSNGLLFTTSAERKTASDGKDFILNKLESKYKCVCSGNNVDVTTTVDTDGVVKGDFGLVSASLPNLKALFKPQIGKSREVGAGFEYQHPNFSLATLLSWKQIGNLGATASFLTTAGRGFSLGLESVYAFRRAAGNTTAIGFDSVKGLLNYKAPQLDASLYLKQEWNLEGGVSSKLTAGAITENKPSPSTTLHAAVEWDFNQKEVSKAFSTQFGGSYQVDSNITTQAKLDHNGLLSVNVSNQLTSNVKGSLSAQFNTLDFGLPSKSIAFGVIYKA